MDLQTTITADCAARDLRGTWQGRVLAAAEGKLAAALLSILAHNFERAMPILLAVVFPGFEGVRAPFYCSAARIMLTGQVAADLITKGGQLVKRAEVYRSEAAFQRELRRLADRIKLNDADREEMFAAARRWIVCDFRIDPTMDPKDPDVRRYVQ